MREEENTPKEYNGKQYTAYEAQQKQRRLETTMRAERQKIKLLKEGGADEEDIIRATARYRGTSAEYSRFSKAMGLPQQRERVYGDGLGSVSKGKWKNNLKKFLTNGINSGNIISFNIGRSIGAAAKNYPVKLPQSHQHTKLVEGQNITGTVFAGKGTNKPIRDRFILERNYGISADKWEKVSGKGKVLINGKECMAELHWYQADDTIVEMKVKRFLKNES